MSIADQSCAPCIERSEHLNAGSSPALEGLQGQGTESLAEFEAEPHSAQADKVQIVVSKADRNRISDESDIGV